MSSEDEDPLDWTVDKVVNFLCHNPQTPWSSSLVRNRPDPVSFEAALRENSITGDVLLQDIDLKILHEDLGIKAFGHRSSIFRAIQYLRKRSFKYQSTQGKPKLRSEDGHDPSRAPSHVDRMTLSGVGTPVREGSMAPSVMTPSIPGPNAFKSRHQELSSKSPRKESFDNRKWSGFEADAEDIDKGFNYRSQESFIVDGQGRKRRRLQLAQQVEEDDGNNRTPKPTKVVHGKEWYMGPHKVKAAQLFYPSHFDEDDQSFVMLGPKFPTAQRFFVNRALNYFYKQEPIKLQSDKGKHQWAVIPYKPLDEDKKRYFTLYTSSNGKVAVRQENVEMWPQLSKSQAPAEALGLSDPFAYLIQKYPVEQDNPEEAYPVYGDSGSEGEYDESTWQEIYDEQRDTSHGKPTRLSRSEVETVIKDCAIEYESKWHELKKPKEEQGARKFWLKAKRGRSTNQQIKLLSKEIQLQESRLKKVQDTICGNDYFAISELKLLCQSMENPVFSVTKQRWRISVLEQEKCPPKIASAPESRHKPRPEPNKDGEESLSSESDSDVDEPMEDFVGEDGFNGNPDIADEVASRHGTRLPSRMSLGSSDDDIISPSGKKRKSRTQKRNPLSLRSSSSEVPAREHETATKKSDTDLIDLTMDSPPPDELAIETPPLNPVPSPKKSPRRLAGVIPKTESPSVSPGPELGSRVSVEIPSQKRLSINSTNNDLPGINDFAALAKLDWTRIEERSDRGRLLAKLIASLPDEERATMAETIPTYGVPRLKRHIRNALSALSQGKGELPGFTASNNQLVMRATSLYISYVNCTHLSQESISRHQIVNAQMDLSGFFSFFEVLCKHLWAYYDWKHNQETPLDNTLHKKRKREVKESQHTKLHQENAQERVLIQEKQKEQFQKTWENMGISNDDPKHQVVSFGDPVIYLPPHNGSRVKPHQLRGIQFLWRELIQDENQQGCLLAHTMGLGKTMQVYVPSPVYTVRIFIRNLIINLLTLTRISLLATISAAAASSNQPQIREQIPKHLHRSQTLVLCPSSLIDNWYEEFLMWMPRPNRLGPLRKITATISLDKRLQKVANWDKEGGILIMSYDIFRTWILNKETKARGRPYPDQESDQEAVQDQIKGRRCLSNQDHERAKHWLLEGPNIIVADEAHKMKNSSTGVYQAAAQFRSKSRIALTGSPLANNLVDYYTMVNWIAEGYLGDYKEFMANYVEPIEEGLYADSTHGERRRSLVRLQVLKEILEPKVNRADISALAGSLPPKVEFVITVPLTKLQADAYNLYVNSVFSGFGDIGNTKLWSWLAILGLCCNHPKCFWDKLNSRANETQKPGRDKEYSAPGDESIDQSGIPDSASLVSRQRPLFVAFPDLAALDLSYRALILDKIISESLKAGDKILIFSHSLPTLNYIEHVLKGSNRRYCRLDGRTPIGSRQSATKAFNKSEGEQVYLISTRAGGLGLNIPGANRVVIFDFQFNPVWEEQAVGRVYRLGQQKPVFVYRFISGGTFEEKIFGKAIFKTHLANRVVDKKNPIRWASKSIGEYLQPAAAVPQKDLSEFLGKDHLVLDKIIENDNGPEKIIRKITLTETLQREDNDNLTEEEKQGVQMHLSDERLKRTDPRAYQELIMKREADAMREQARLMAERTQTYPPIHPNRLAQMGMPPPPPPPPLPHQISHNVGPRPLPPDMSISQPVAPPTNGGSASFSAPVSYLPGLTAPYSPMFPHSLPSRPPPSSTPSITTTPSTAASEPPVPPAKSSDTTGPPPEVFSVDSGDESEPANTAPQETTNSNKADPKEKDNGDEPPAKDRAKPNCKTQ